MRPTDIGYRSPREKTPAFYSTFVSISGPTFECKATHLIRSLLPLLIDESQVRWLVQPFGVKEKAY